jgi:hypothetical protein
LVNCQLKEITAILKIQKAKIDENEELNSSGAVEAYNNLSLVIVQLRQRNTKNNKPR